MRGVMFAVIPSPLFAIVLADDTVLSARVKPRFLRQVETPNSASVLATGGCVLIPSVLIRPSRLYTTLKRRAYAAVR